MTMKVLNDKKGNVHFPLDKISCRTIARWKFFHENYIEEKL